MASDELVASEVQDGLGIIRLADPEHRNAVSVQMSRQLATAVERLLEASVGALVITAEPPAFCAGGALADLLDRSVRLEDIYRGFLTVGEAEVPTVAAVNGPAVGAGMNLALACDVVITSPKGRFDPRFLDLAIHPGGGHLWRLLRRVGPQAAAAMVLCGEALDGEQAVAAGLAWCCVPEDQVEPVARALAGWAAARPRDLVVRTKASLRASQALADPEEAVALERAAQEWSMDQPAFSERVRAAQERIRRRAT